MITGIAHACYTVADLDRAVDFYRDMLGLTVAFEFLNDRDERFGVYLHVGQRTFIELFAGDPGDPPERQSYSHLCLETDNIEQTVAFLRERGLEVGDISLGSDRSLQAWLADPDGNRIELHCYTDESRQAPWLRTPSD